MHCPRRRTALNAALWLLTCIAATSATAAPGTVILLEQVAHDLIGARLLVIIKRFGTERHGRPILRPPPHALVTLIALDGGPERCILGTVAKAWRVGCLAVR